MAQIDHLGIAVKSLAAAKSIYEKLGLDVSLEETVEPVSYTHLDVYKRQGTRDAILPRAWR